MERSLIFKASVCGILLLVFLPGICRAGQTSTASQTASRTGASYSVNLSTSVSAPAQAAPTSYLIEIYPKSSAAKVTPKTIGTEPQHITVTSAVPTSRQMWDPPIQVKATSDSKLPIVFSVDGPATYSSSVITITGPGTVTWKASQGGNQTYAATSVTGTIQVPANDSYCLPSLMPAGITQTKSGQSTKIGSIVQYLGNPYPFTVINIAQGKYAIYSSRIALTKSDQATLKNIEATIEELTAMGELQPLPSSAAANAQQAQASPAAAQTPVSGTAAATATTPAYSIEVSVPHYKALGDLATRFSSINPGTFTVQDVGRDRIRITSQTIPSCHVVTEFLDDIRDIAWKTYPEPSVANLFHLQTSDVVAALGGIGGGSQSGSPAGSGTVGGSMNSQAGGNGVAVTGGATAAATGPASGTTSGGTSASTPQTGGAGPTGGSSPGGGPVGQTPTPSSGKSGVTVVGIGTDMLLLTDPNPGDDAGIAEVKRVLAQLDLPRPEIQISAWSMQTSSKNPALVGEFHKNLDRTVEDYNDGLQSAVARAWENLTFQMSHPTDEKSYFDQDFYRYVTGRYVEDLQPQTGDDNPETIAGAILQKRETGPTAKKPPVLITDADRAGLGMCKAKEYCLGYTTLFQALKPRLTDMLLAVIAAKDPANAIELALNHMECAALGGDGSCAMSPPVEYPKCKDTFEDPCPARNDPKKVDGSKVRQAQPNDGHIFLDSPPPSCERIDQYNELHYIRVGLRPTFFLECLRQAANALLRVNDTQKSKKPLAIGLTRAAIADFLFNYKWAQEFPHDFGPYFLSQSAQALDSALSPFTDAFNRDVSAYQEFLRDQLVMQQTKERRDFEHGWLGIEKPTFINDGIITVQTLSSKEATVSTASQNFLDATQQPTIAGLLASLEAAVGKPAAAPATGPMTDVLQNLKPIQAQILEGLVNSVQAQKIQVGRSLYIDVTPRSQPGASAAELTVNMKSDDSGNPTYFTPVGSTAPGSGSAADVSRVSQHDVTTTVRVESMKLFEVSSFSAILQQSRTRFPVLPPFVEIPYVGTLIGVPIHGAKEYHSSTAVLSAIVVPTAADLANGLVYVDDLVVNVPKAIRCRAADSTSPDDGMLPACVTPESQKSADAPKPAPVVPYIVTCRWPTSQPSTLPEVPRCTTRIPQTSSDLSSLIVNFHKMKINCLGTGTPLNTVSTKKDESALTCSNLTFDSVLGGSQ
jgi:hypothetical protein